MSDAIFVLFLFWMKRTGNQKISKICWQRVELEYLFKSLIKTCELTEWNVYIKMVHTEKLVKEALSEGILSFRAVWATWERHTSKENDASGKDTKILNDWMLFVLDEENSGASHFLLLKKLSSHSKDIIKSNYFLFMKHYQILQWVVFANINLDTWWQHDNDII